MKFTKSFLVFLFVSVAIATFFVAVFYTDTVKAALWSVNSSDSLTLSPSTNSISLSWSLSQINGGTQTIYRNGSAITSVGVGTSSYTNSGLATCTSYSYSVCSAYGCASASVSTTGCDPCAGVTCNAYCSGSTAYYSGYCSGGACYYSTDNCANGFCSGMVPYPGSTCTSGVCNRTAGSTCLSSTCSGTTYLYSGYCSAGSCGYGASSITAGTCGAVCTPGTTRTMYANSQMACGNSCLSETQTCNSSGTGWSGSYTLTSCTPTTRTAYGALTSACGTYSYTSETQTCQTSGAWSPYNYTLTSPPSATTQTRYAAATSACGTYGSNSETQTCQSNGSFSGTYTLTSPATITTRTRYAAATSACGTYGSNSETQSCLAGGSFSGSYTLTSPPSASTRTMYAASSVACGGVCSSETQTCLSSGSWSGTYAYSSCSVTACPPATPGAPTLTGSTQSSVSISWSAVANALEYYMYKDGVYVGYVSYLNPLSYTFSGLSCSTNYSITISAVGSGGASGQSSPLLALTQLCIPATTAPSNGSWVNSRQFCAWVDGYPGVSTRGKFVIGGTTYNGGYNVGDGSSCYTHTGDLSGVSWYVYSEDSALRTSPNSASWTAYIDTVAPTPNPPTISLTSADSSSVTATISSGSDTASGLNATPYGFSIDGGAYTWQSGTSKAFSGVSCGVSHTVTGKIRDAAGNETSVGSGTITPLCAPTGVSAVFSYGGTPTLERVDISWNAVSGATSYTIYEKVNGGSWQTISPDYSWGATSKSVRNGTLSCGSTYEYAVVANGPTGSSSMSASSGVMTYTTPGSLPNFAIYASNNTSIWLSTWWGSPYLPSGGAAPLYNIRRNGVLIATIPQYDYIDSGLSQNTLYSYTIQPTNACGGGPTSPSYSGRTLGSMSMSQGGSTQTSISACWSDPVNPSHPDVDTYNYRNIIRNSGAASYSSLVGSTSGCWSDTGLSCGTGYTYIARSGLTVMNKGNGTGLAGASVDSPTYTFYTSDCDTTPPTFSITGSNSSWTTSANVTATASDVSGVSYVRHCWADTGTMPPCDPGTTSANTFTNGATLTQTTSGSSWYVCFRASDTNGNWTPAPTSVNYASYCWGPVRVDTTAPTPNPPSPSESSTSADSITVVMGTTGSDAHSGMNSTPYGYAIDGGSYSWTSSGANTFSGLLCETNHTIYGKLQDAVGNQTSAGSVSITTGSCVVAPTTVSAVTATEKSGGGGLSASWTNVGANGYRVYLRGGRSSANTTTLITDTGNATIPSQTGLDCPGTYSVIVVPYNSDTSLGGGTHSSCISAFSDPLLSGVLVPTNRKCAAPTVGTVSLTSCTKGFLFE